MELQVCLHVTSLNALPDVLKEGLTPRIGPMSVQLEQLPAIYLFPSWADMWGAYWLFDDWQHDSEPALLCVRTDGLALEVGAGFEVISRAPIEASRITVLVPGELGWDAALPLFLAHGGLEHDAETLSG